jgi:spore coat protein A
MDVDRGRYRLRILNGCDGVTLQLRFLVVVDKNFTTKSLPHEDATGWTVVPFQIIGGDQGFAKKVIPIDDYLVVAPAARYDIIIDFSEHQGQRIILQNVKNGGSTNKTANYDDSITDDFFTYTDRVMAFDVNNTIPEQKNTTVELPPFPTIKYNTTRTRKLGIFPGKDPFGRDQLLLGTVEGATDKDSKPICWPNGTEMHSYIYAGLTGEQMTGTTSWHDPTTENIKMNATEEWEIWNFGMFPHPIHVSSPIFL